MNELHVSCPKCAAPVGEPCRRPHVDRQRRADAHEAGIELNDSVLINETHGVVRVRAIDGDVAVLSHSFGDKTEYRVNVAELVYYPHVGAWGRDIAGPAEPREPETVKKLDIFGNVIDTHATEAELNGWRAQQGRLI